MERIMVYNLVGSSALSGNEGEILYAEIEKALADGACVTVDFNGVDTVLAQFLNSAVATLYEKHSSEELRERLTITGLKSTGYLRKVIARAKTFYTSGKVSGYVKGINVLRSLVGVRQCS